MAALLSQTDSTPSFSIIVTYRQRNATMRQASMLHDSLALQVIPGMADPLG